MLLWDEMKWDYYRNDSILLLNQEVNSSVVNQTWIIHYKLTCLSEVLRYCKSDQILELCYQQQEDVLRQKNINISK